MSKPIQIMLKGAGLPVPEPKISLGAPPKSKIFPQYRNYVDAGDPAPRRYDGLETAVQRAEFADSVVSNTGAAAGGAARIIPASAKVAPLLTGAKALGSKLAPVQAALWSVDAGRAVLSEDYRKETMGALEQTMDGGSPTWMKALAVLANTLGRPVATPAAMMRSYTDSQQRIATAHQKMVDSNQRVEEMQRDRQARQTPGLDRLSDRPFKFQYNP